MAQRPPLEMARSRAYYLMHRAALARLRARLAPTRESAIICLKQGQEMLRKSIEEFKSTHTKALPNAEIHLAGLLIDHARLVDGNPQRDLLLLDAEQILRAADNHVADTYERPYLALEWAWYCRVAGRPAEAENHIASARRFATAAGNRSIQVNVESSMGVHLRGPTGKDRWEVMLPPGEQLDIPVFAVDWCGRPMMGYALTASVVSPAGPGQAQVMVQASEQLTSPLGQVSFHVEAIGSACGTVMLEVRDHNVLRETHAWRFTSNPSPSRSIPRCRRAFQPQGEDVIVLRHLFGPRFRHILIRKEFSSGLAGARVMLVEPYLTPPPGPGRLSLPNGKGRTGGPALPGQGGPAPGDSRGSRLLRPAREGHPFP